MEIEQTWVILLQTFEFSVNFRRIILVGLVEVAFNEFSQF
jgi:hypothetical protein